MIKINNECPIYAKSCLKLDEAASYFNIGINKLREVTNQKECEPYILCVGNRKLIKRKPFEKFLYGLYSL